MLQVVYGMWAVYFVVAGATAFYVRLVITVEYTKKYLQKTGLGRQGDGHIDQVCGHVGS